MAKTIEHHWHEDPDLARAIKGETIVGGQRYLYILDPQADVVLRSILTELKKMNVQLATMTGDDIHDFDIEGIEP